MHPDLFVKMGEFEIQVFLGGLKNGWLDQNLAVKAALSLSEVKHYRKILERLLVNLYRSYPEMQVLEALCGLLIRGEKKDRSAFGWYEKALKAISILQGFMNISFILCRMIMDMPFQKKCYCISLMINL